MTKKRDILYSVAYCDNELVTASHAIREKLHTCPVCSGEMILNRGQKKRPHFSHKALSQNCTPESALHYGFKMLLAAKLKDCIATQRPLEIQWGCRYCLERHTGNLVKKASRVEVEYNLGECQPDIALLDSDDKVIAVVEVVVTHAPEEKVLEYYEKNKIGAVVFQLKSDADLDLISEQMRPDEVYSCLNPRCPRCSERTNKRELVVIDSQCGRCKRAMSVAAFMGGSLCGTFFPSDVKMAESKGVQIGYWKKEHSTWLAPTSACKHCDAVVGLPWLWDKHANPDLDLPSTNYGVSGYYCNSCERDLNGHRAVIRRG